jgi:hypothetical protein
MYSTPTGGGSGQNSSTFDYQHFNKSDIFGAVFYQLATRYRLANDVSLNFTSFQGQAIFALCTNPNETTRSSSTIYSSATAGALLFKMFYNESGNALVTGGTGTSITGGGLTIGATPLYYYNRYVYIIGGWSSATGTLSNTVRRFYDLSGSISDANLETLSIPALSQGSYGRIVSMCVDTNGVFYFLDQGSSIVFSVNYTTNTSSIYAGTWNVAGYSGDRGLATSARINIGTNPSFITMDGENNLFIGDRGNNRIRVVSYITKKIYTIAGTGIANNSSGVVNNTGSNSNQINFSPETLFYHKYTNRLVVGQVANLRRYISSIFLGQTINIVTNPNFTYPSDKTGDQYGPINQTELTTYLLGWNSSAFNTTNVTSRRFINNMNNNNASPSIYDARNITGTTPITTCFYITQAGPCIFDISQNITFPAPRKYFLQFWAAPRTGNGTQSNFPYNYDTQSINLVIDGTVKDTYVFKNQTAFPNGRFELLTSNITTTTANETHTLTIRWIQTGTNDSSIMVTGVEVYYLNMDGW